MRICIDLDGVICELRQSGQDYSEVAAVEGAAQRIQEMRQQGHTIIIHTARHMKTCAGNIGLVVARKGKDTLDWLAKHRIEYDEFHFGKPWADIYIDDNALRFDSWQSLRIESLPMSTESLLKGSQAPDATRAAVTAVIALAGRGERFAASRFVNANNEPFKPWIEVAGRPMIWWALRSLTGIDLDSLVFVFRDDDPYASSIGSRLSDLLQELTAASELRVGNIHFVQQKGNRSGQLLSVLEARSYIDDDCAVLIASSDTYIRSRLASDIQNRPISCHGIVSVAELPGSRWSFARLDEDGRIVEVAEKKRISRYASTGLYYFTNGRDFLRHADVVLRKNITINGEYYIMPVFSEYLINECEIRPSLCRSAEVYEMGTPESLEVFLAMLRGRI